MGRLKPLYLVLALGELVRLAFLALLGADRFYPEGNAPAGVSAWLLVYLSPHAVAVSLFVYVGLAGRAATSAVGLSLPAKALGALAALGALIAETASGSSGHIRLALPVDPIPDRLIAAGLFVWDLGVLAILVLERQRQPQPEQARSPEPLGPAGPVYREDSVESVDARIETDGVAAPPHSDPPAAPPP